MKVMFKKSFGIVAGLYAGCLAVNAFSEIVKRLKGEEDTPKKEESKFEEES